MPIIETKPNVWIIIPTFNRVNTLLECLASLNKQTYENTNIIIVDDMSKDGTCSFVRELYPDAVLLSGDSNRWWSGCMNIGLAYALSNGQEHDYFMSFNDDVLVDDNYIETMVSQFDTCHSKCIIGSLSLDSADPNKVVYSGTKINWRIGIWKGAYNKVDTTNHLFKTDALPGRGMIAPLKLIKDIGFYDDRIFPQYFGDEDFSLRAKRAGYLLYVCSATHVDCHVDMTGTGRSSMKLLAFIKTLFSIRSPNQLYRRWMFILRHCPRYFMPSFIVLDTLKIVTSYFRMKMR